MFSQVRGYIFQICNSWPNISCMLIGEKASGLIKQGQGDITS